RGARRRARRAAHPRPAPRGPGGRLPGERAHPRARARRPGPGGGLARAGPAAPAGPGGGHALLWEGGAVDADDMGSDLAEVLV
ncbi:MAG: tRNA(Ile)-lysidine synthetase, partial [uncultured Quadrisphaera sp.]